MITRLDTLDELERAGWRSLTTAAGFFFSYEWLAYRRDTPPLGRSVYFVGGPAEAPVIGMPSALYDATIGRVRYTRADLVIVAALERAGLEPREWRSGLEGLMPNLYCGAPQIGFGHPIFGPGGSPTDLDALLTSVAREAGLLGAASTAFLYVDEHDHGLRDRLLSHGYVEIPSSLHSTMRIRWSSFDAYLAHFRHGRRSAIRRELRALEAAGVEFAVLPLSQVDPEVLAPLIVAVDAKYSGGKPVVGDEDATADMLRRRARSMGDQTLASVAMAGDRVRAVALLHEGGDQLFARDIGFDYAYQGRLPLYFSVLFYEPVRYAISRGFRSIDYGIEFASEKVSRGADAVQQYAYVRGLDADVHAVAAEAAAAISDRGRDGPRPAAR